MKSLFSVFKRGFQKTATAITRTLFSVISDEKPWDSSTYAQIEAALLKADFGVQTTRKLMEDLRDRYGRGLIKTSADVVKTVTAEIIQEMGTSTSFMLNPQGLTVVLLVGVNGSGKTTTAGKLAQRYRAEGRKVILAACDTFRAAAVEQLHLWAERTGCQLISAKAGADPAAVAYDAVAAAVAREADLLIIDTAGRQHTKKGLMDELTKITRVIQKQIPEAPHHIWLTVDASSGGNALVQAKEFSGAAGVNGLILTKLDGSFRGGIVVAIHRELKLPIRFVGLGEQPDDLQPFDAEHYANALFSEGGVYLPE